MQEPSTIIGIDIGSVAIALVTMNPGGEIIQTDYQNHHGQVDVALSAMLAGLNGLNMADGFRVSVTTSTPNHIRAHRRCDSRIAVIGAARRLYPHVGAIVHVGGEKFGLLRFDAQGNYLGYKTNTSCAAGTGSFLDQQARRLNLDDIPEFVRHAVRHQGPPLKIASRCAVFAKTDLIHAQQEGHDVAAICDGLCYGLAENIYGALFAGELVEGPIIMCGGVARNPVVVGHLAALIGIPLEVHPRAHLFGALGAALALQEQWEPVSEPPFNAIGQILRPRRNTRDYAHAPLTLELSDYPDFTMGRHYLFSPRSTDRAPSTDNTNPVEVDVYRNFDAHGTYPAFLGIDIGSTSTKAVIIDTDGEVMAGFYTRTAGNPLAALQSLLAALDDLQRHESMTLEIRGAGTTGSGRKFIGRVAGADLVVDEITAHARAAAALNPDVDTIIEIGGQDAKFTTLDKGAVTFAVMNSVCAAGTGSFIEEQAQQLACPLEEVATRTLNHPAPMASDRCTVFMERDLHHYLNEGYSVDEVLTAVLHSVRENYLTKVAVEGLIGRNVLFQGATAKNKALVAAFEQRLGQPIHVSRYCHLTGALGVGLMLIEQNKASTAFRGIGLWRKRIPLQREVCDLCANHCKITLAAIDEERVAFGFSCGRDYDTRRYVHRNPSGFDLLRERSAALTWKAGPVANGTRPVIGIPAALHLFEDLEMWRCFFNTLGFKVVTSRSFEQGVTEGRRAAGAQFCAPMAALQGHVKYLQDRCDKIFLPYYLETKPKARGVRRQFCYYTQFSVPLASMLTAGSRCSEFLSPLVHYLYNSLHTRIQLYKMLKALCPHETAFTAVSAAYDRARAFKQEGLARLRTRFREARPEADEICAVLLGRPYTVLSSSMNKNIPGILAALGIRTFYQDMLDGKNDSHSPSAPLLKELHWYHAAAILASAEEVGRRPGAYPVLITSFKCSPDAFVIDYFKQAMAACGKPYLILQVDDHDSSGGYETRIEAAVRAFRNHHQHHRDKQRRKPTGPIIPLIPIRKGAVEGKTLLLPNWDDLTIPLIAAALQREGFDARALEHSPATLQKSLRHNTGQCIPVNIIAQECIDYIDRHALDPAATLLWMPQADIACNIHLYPAYIQQMLQRQGKRTQGAGVYVGPMSMSDLSLKMPLRAYFAYMFGGYLRRLGCKLRPYETVAGSTDRVQAAGLALLTHAFAGRTTYEAALDQLIALFEQIEVTAANGRPKVAIFGDLYARDNASINQNLIPFIEANGGEVLPTPYSDYMKMIARPYLRKWFIEGHYLEVVSSKLILAGLKRRETLYYSYFQRILDEPEPVYDDPPARILERYHLRPENTGESMDNLLKIHYLAKHHPDIALMVQVSPAFCCPALVTEAMARRIEQVIGRPVVSITYDGTGGNKNEAIIPYLAFPRTSVEINPPDNESAEWR